MSVPRNPALCHDWLNGMRGGEKCLEVFCEMFPAAPIYTLFHEPAKVSGAIARHEIRSSYLQRFPGILRWYRYFLPLFFSAIESLDLKQHDFVLSTSHCVAKAARHAPSSKHLCYCFTPARYAWGFFDEYFGRSKGPLRLALRFFLENFKRRDRENASRVDAFVAISHHIRKRIERCYGRTAAVVYPPVDTDFYTPDPQTPAEEFYLVVSALVPYKRVDLAVEVFRRNGKRLVVIGDGPERARLEASLPANIRFLGWQPDEILRDYYRKCRALMFPGEEDFGIVPVEVQACGRFVIAYGKGGALETVEEGRTGVFFSEQTVPSLQEGLERFERLRLDGSDSRRNAERFSRARFKGEMAQVIRELTC